MKEFFQFLLRAAAGVTTTFCIMFISLIMFDMPSLFSILIGIVGGGGVFYFLKWFFQYHFLKQQGISSREYKYVKRNLKEAKLKINRLQKAMFRVRNVADFKQNYEVMRVVNKIYSITKKEPKRFFRAERFYFTNLDSLVELTEKYALLHSQPAQTSELKISLKDTKITINQLTDSIQGDLYKILEDDIDDLHFELDVAKKTVNRDLTKENHGGGTIGTTKNNDRT